MKRIRFSLRTLVIFVLLCGSGFGLWYRWEPWRLSSWTPVMPSDQTFPPPRVLSADGSRILVTPSIHSVEVLLTTSDGGTDFRPVYTFQTPSFINRAEFCDDETILLWSTGVLSSGELGVYNGILRRRRPEWWWGIAWLPEFWATVIFGVGLVWSVGRDRRGLRVQPESKP